MWPAALTRLLRRRIIYIVIVLLLLIYILGHFFDRNPFNTLHYDDYVVQRTRPLLWHQQLLEPDEQLNRTHDPDQHCRNSVQGIQWLADELGFVCQREQILPSGCCNSELPDVSYYSCHTCNQTSMCCEIYEYCVSCCLHPDKRPLLETILETVNAQRYIYAQVEDHFELCLVKCRTNSHSVEHENKYRNARTKHCYGQTEAHESQREVAPQGQKS
ncbi:uncharacterized protein Dwil_GK19833 [Drosophila willistoni]|uniref:SREBP regulating gene protein n=1 Tax=Drosophila willistoni TaxID=7260 RepID=B4MSU2_DROWI|nr:SREBP regulating gene protein [Drosophila willistoni]EDW75181.1 uncharacterized protein Dwil_GK19833 [Drosophila willistoni]